MNPEDMLKDETFSGLLADVVDKPLDDPRRGVLADYLVELGEDNWAELIQVGCRLREISDFSGNHPVDDLPGGRPAAIRTLTRRSNELQDIVMARPAFQPPNNGAIFDRGLPVVWHYDNWQHYLKDAQRHAALWPLQEMRLDSKVCSPYFRGRRWAWYTYSEGRAREINSSIDTEPGTEDNWKWLFVLPGQEPQMPPYGNTPQYFNFIPPAVYAKLKNMDDTGIDYSYEMAFYHNERRAYVSLGKALLNAVKPTGLKKSKVRYADRSFNDAFHYPNG